MNRVRQFIKKILHFLRKRWWVILIVLGIGGWIVYGQTIGKKPEKELSYTVKRQTIRETLSFSGDVDAEEKATLRFQTSGKLAWIGVNEGESVKQYQAIASLDQRSMKKTLQKELNDYAKERLDFDEEKDDTREVVIGALNADTRRQLLRAAEQAQYDLNSSVLDVEIQTITVELANLYTPIAGIVTKMGTKHAGVNVTPTQAEFEIVNPDTIFFSAVADQTEVVNLNEGMTGEVVFDSFPDEAATGTITSVSFSPDEDETGTVYGIKLALDNFSDVAKLRLGMTGDVTFVIKEQENAIAIPTTFIKSEKAVPAGRQGKEYVLKKVGDKKEKVYVQTGEEIDIATVILSGLKEGDVIYD